MKIAFLADPRHAAALAAEKELRARYGQTAFSRADYLVVLGGDGTMLHTLHKFFPQEIPFYGMNLGTLGFLMNSFQSEGLEERLQKASAFEIHPLLMEATTVAGEKKLAHAFNEVSLLRQTHQAAKIRLWIDGTLRLNEVVCDGLLVSTPVGSTAYNFSNNGPILPIDAGLLALTPISPFRPRYWRGALLKHTADVVFEVLEEGNRCVSAVADFIEVRDVVRVHVRQDQTKRATLLFDPEHDLKERTLREQFAG